jgi:tRNA-modifying protein YgfZ
MSAVLVEAGPDLGGIWHFGEPNKEQQFLISGGAWVKLSNRAVISVTGEDRLRWLHDITTQDVEALGANIWKPALILDALGHIKFQLDLVDDGQATWLVTDLPYKEELLAFLIKMKFMLRVEVKDRSEEYICVRTAGLPDAMGGPYKIVKKDELNEAGVEVGLWALEAERVAAGRARLGFETDHKSIPNELGLLNNAVHMKKGCYPGQETVAKINNLGTPPRKLVLLHLDGLNVDLPKTGDKVFDGEKEVGFIGTVIRHYELGPIGLAVLRKSVPLENTLIVGGISASQEVIIRK